MRCNGLNLHVTLAGDRRAPALLLVHGNGEDHRIFDAAIPALSMRYFVITPDSRGHGASASVARLTYADMAEDMAALLEALSVRACTFFGFSDGGIVGLLLAIHHPQTLMRLIVAGANTHPFGVDGACYLQTLCEYLRTREDKMRLMLTQPRISRAALARVSTPTLVLAGEHDVIRPSHTRRLAMAIPGARLRIVPGEDHGSYIVNSTRFVTAAEL